MRFRKSPTPTVNLKSMPDQPTTHREFHDAFEAADRRLELQVQTALNAAEKLEIQRINEVHAAAMTWRENLDRRFDEGDKRLAEMVREADVRVQTALEASRRENQMARDGVLAQIEKVEATTRTRMDEGDDRLREHILGQADQINAALESARREQKLSFDASQEAIAKAAAATNERLHGMNEFREQLADQAARFVPREVAEAEFRAIRESLQAISKRLDTQDGRDSQVTRQENRVQPWQLAAVTGIITVIIFVANFLSTNL